MLSPHIQARENFKTLDLLSFALNRSGVDRRAWQVATSFSDLAPCDDCVCLYGQGAGWTVSYTERGQWREMAHFTDLFEASKYFYAHFRPGASPYDVREQWEDQTGQQFSMVE
jgi:hypothetical protein